MDTRSQSLAGHEPKTTSLYQYSPLPMPDSIRLVHLYKKGDQISGILEYVQLSALPVYTAVSYVWGYQTGTKPFLIDDHEVQITTNLADFIETTLESSTSLFYWIDAICINQSDDEEKSAQVQIMPRIYESASNVLIWLGKEDDTSQHCIDFMAKCHVEACKRDGGLTPVCLSSGLLEMLQSRPKDTHIQDQESWECLGRFFRNRQWWGRIWTIQEYIHPVSKQFMCGGTEFPTRWILDTMRLHGWLREEQDFSLEGLGCSRPWGIEAFVRAMNDKSRPPMTVYEVLCSLRLYLATDPRDKVFALLGLIPADRRTDPNLTIDYSLEAGAVFTNLAEHFLNESRNLDWLEAASTTVVQDCPSWVPDWSYVRNRKPLPKRKRTTSGQGSPVYVPWGDGKAIDWDQEGPRIIKSPQGAKLHLTGVCLDQVSRVGKHRSDRYELDILQSWVVDACAGRDIYPQTGEAILQAVLRTIAVDARRVDYKVWDLHVRGVEDLEVTPDMDIQAIARAWMFTDSKNYGVQDIYHTRRRIASRRRFVETSCGFIGLATRRAQVGDKVYAFAGGTVLYLVRDIPGTSDRYTFVGECYIHGLMDGEWRTGDGFEDPHTIMLE
ncbi:Fc.00g080450.m01.CDS01 [Cosmosporella sp. VM-42]